MRVSEVDFGAWTGREAPAQVETNAAASTRPLLSDGDLRVIDEVAPA